MSNTPRARQRRASHSEITVPAAPWSLDAAALMAALRASDVGLAPREATRRQRAPGHQALAADALPAWPRLLLRQFASPLVLILLFAAAVSLLLRDWTEAAIIGAIVGGSALLGFVQEWRASVAVAQLRQRVALDRARAARRRRTPRGGGAGWCVGDIVQLAAGNLVPADGVLLRGARLPGHRGGLDRRIVAGRETRRRLRRRHAAGAARQLRLPRHLGAQRHGQRAGHRHRPRHRVRRGGRAHRPARARDRIRARRAPLRRAAAAGDGRDGAVRRADQSVVGPAAGSIRCCSRWRSRSGCRPSCCRPSSASRVARGARAMARRGVIVRRLEAIENLGSIDVLCTDKTGTLTERHGGAGRRARRAGQRSAAVAHWAYTQRHAGDRHRQPARRGARRRRQSARASTPPA